MRAEMAIDVNEAWFAGIKTGHLGIVDVFKNPSRAELMKLLHKDEYHSARVLATPNDIYLIAAENPVLFRDGDECRSFSHLVT